MKVLNIQLCNLYLVTAFSKVTLPLLKALICDYLAVSYIMSLQKMSIGYMQRLHFYLD